MHDSFRSPLRRFKKQNAIVFILLSTLSACSTPRTFKIPMPRNPGTVHKVPELKLPSDAHESYFATAQILYQYGNNDEFYSYAKSHMHKLSAGNAENVDLAIREFRSCLEKMKPVPIVWEDREGHVIGAWKNQKMVQNKRLELDPIQRSGHWLHELSHGCGFTHDENDLKFHPEIKNSFPYQIGDQFESYLRGISSEECIEVRRL